MTRLHPTRRGAETVALPQRPLARLAQNEELGRPGREAGGRRGLEQMTRRKREIIGLTNERDFPHLVELALPPGGFRSVFLEIDAFHRERRIPVRRGRSRYDVKPFHIRFCFQTLPLRTHSSIASVVSA